MKKYEMLNQLQNEMKEARTTVEQLCADWGWTLSDKETTTNEIVINKGKVVEVQTVKEIVIDNTDTATIEMLRETIRKQQEAMRDMQKQIEELEETIEENKHEYADELDIKDTIIENLKAQLKTEKEKQPRIVYVEVTDDPTYNNEPKEKPVVKQTKAKEVFDLAYEELESHDGVKVKVRDLKNNITFYAVKNLKYDKPAYSVSGNKFTRHPNVVKHLYKYDEQLTEHLMNRLSKKFNLQQTIEENIHDEQEIVVNVTKEASVVETQVDDDPLAGAEDIDL